MVDERKDAPPSPYRVAIVDDHPAVRDGLATRLSLEADMRVCGQADSQQGALHMVRETNPDVVVVDISLKTGDGIDLIKQLAAAHPSVRVLVCSMYADSLYAERALRAGALGYINKEQSTNLIVEALRRVLDGKVYLGPEIHERLLKEKVGETGFVGRDPVERLSDRELQTFSMIGQGLNTQEIAKRMFLSPKTVETYRARIKLKLGISDLNQLNLEAVRWAMKTK